MINRIYAFHYCVQLKSDAELDHIKGPEAEGADSGWEPAL